MGSDLFLLFCFDKWLQIYSLISIKRFPVCAIGVLRWVDYTVSEPSYFKLNTDHTPLHLVLVDEVRLMIEKRIKIQAR